MESLRYGEPLLSKGSKGSLPKDEQLFRDGVAAERGGNSEQARKRYLSITQNHKRSRFVPMVYLRFGELFAAQGRVSPNYYDMAVRSFREVLKYSPPDNVGYFYASWQLGILKQAMGGHAQALSDFKRAAEGASSHPKAHCMSSIARRARRQSIKSYAEVGQPRMAFRFFRLMSGDKGANNEDAITMTLQLAKHLASKRPPDAAYLTEEALRRGASTSHCGDLRALVRQLGSAAAKSKPGVDQLCP